MGELLFSIPPEVRAVLGAFFFACNQILVRRLVDRSSPLTVTVCVNFWMSVVALFLMPATDSFEGSFLRALLFFVGVGIIGQATARYLAYFSNKIVGVSRTNAVVAASPIGAALTGVFILGEQPGIAVWAGIALVVAGLVLLTSERGGERFPLKSYLFAFVATAAFSLTPYLRKGGMMAMNAAGLGVIISSIVANSALLATSRFLTPAQKFRLDNSVFLASVPAGIFGMAAAINFWTALRDGPLTVIAPLIRVTPIFVLILSAVLLRGRERINWRLVIATFIVVGGAVLVASAP